MRPSQRPPVRSALFRIALVRSAWLGSAMRELESLVRDLETGKAKLDDAVRADESGAALKAHCEAKLAVARMKMGRAGRNWVSGL